MQAPYGGKSRPELDLNDLTNFVVGFGAGYGSTAADLAVSPMPELPHCTVDGWYNSLVSFCQELDENSFKINGLCF